MNEKRKKIEQDWREIRRFRAGERKPKGWKQKDIAEAWGVSEGAVSGWISRAEAAGEEGLRKQSRGHRKARLTEGQQAQLPTLLEQGAEHFGFRGDGWTRARVAAVIERTFGVRFSLVHVGRLLKAMRWSSQKPLKRATQRHEAASEQWRDERWSELEKSP